MKKLIEYIVKQTVSPFLIGLGGFLIFVSIELLYQLSDIIVRYKVGIDKLFLLIYYNLPYFMVLGIPVGILLGIFWVLSRMRTDNELIALQTHGITLRKLVIPFVIFALAMSFVSYLFNDYLVPAGNRKASEALAKYVYKRPEMTFKENAFMEDGEGRYLYIKRIDPETGTLNEILLYDMSKPGKTRVISADNATFENNRWVMHSGRIYETDGKGFLTMDMTFKSFDLQFEQDIEEYIRTSKSPREMSSKELREKIESYDKIGVETASLKVALQEKISTALGPLVIVLMGVPLSLMLNLRTKAWSVILTFVLVVVYQGSGAWLSAMGKERLIDPVLAPWLPNIFFTAIGVGIYFLIDTKISYKFSEMLNSIFKIGVVLLIIFVGGQVFAYDINISAESFQGKGNEIRLHGPVKLEYSEADYDVTIEASNASVLLEGDKPISATFWGNVVLTTKESVINAERVVFEFDRKSIQSFKVNTKQGLPVPKVDDSEEKQEIDFYVYTEYSESTMEASPLLNTGSGYITTCDYEKPHYRFNVTEATVRQGKYIIAENLVMTIGKVPVFYLPWYYFSLEDPERRPFSFEITSFEDWKSKLTLRYLNVEWLNLAFIWERYWKSGEDSFSVKSFFETPLGGIEILAEYLEIESAFFPGEFGGYVRLLPDINGQLEIAALATTGDRVSDTMKKPFSGYELGYEFVKDKRKARNVFDIAEVLENVESFDYFTFKYNSSESSKIDLSLSAGMATYFEDTFSGTPTSPWFFGPISLQIPTNFKYETPNATFTSDTFRLSFFTGKLFEIKKNSFVKSNLTFRTNAKINKTNAIFFNSSLSIDELSMNIESNATNTFGDLLKAKYMESFVFDLNDYKFTSGNFITNGDITSSFDAEESILSLTMPVDKKGNALNSFKWEAFQSKLKLNGRYGLDYNTDMPATSTERYVWIEPSSISYKGFVEVSSKMRFFAGYAGNWLFNAENSVGKTFDILSLERKSFSFVSSLTPEYSITFEASKTANEGTNYSFFDSKPALKMKNIFGYSPGENLDTHIGYSPEVSYYKSEFEFKHPGEYFIFVSGWPGEMEFVTELDYEKLFTPEATILSFFGDGELSTLGDYEFGDFGFKHNQTTQLESLNPTSTEFSVEIEFGPFYHKTASSRNWTKKTFGIWSNTERLNVGDSELGLEFETKWKLDLSKEKIHERFDYELSLSITIGDNGFGFSTYYPYILKKKKWFERFEFKLTNLTAGNLNVKNAIFDIQTDFRSYDKNYPFPESFFSNELSSTENRRFAIFSVENFVYKGFSMSGAFLATTAATESGEINSRKLSIGINTVTFKELTLFKGKINAFGNYGFSVELHLDNPGIIVNLNSADITKSILLKHLTLSYTEENKYLEIGTSLSDLKWDEMNNHNLPLYFDLHCMALEGILRLNLKPEGLPDFVQSVGLKYYIKALEDRYLVIGYDIDDKFFFEFKF
ncbi:MAG: LptF/LptG family permease [Kosmotogaceae bacterium]